MIELTIAIPTFNRAPMLEESLAALMPQCEGRPVEVCISNNASADGTSGVLSRYPDIRSITQFSNIGLDRNIVVAIRMAVGRYVLPIGDDEVFRPGAIDRVLTALRDSPDMLILNADRERVVQDPRQAFDLFWDKMPLGGFVIRSEYAAPHRTDRYFGTLHAYSGAAWDYLAERPNPAICSIPDRLIDFRPARKSYSNVADIVHFQCIPKWFDLLPPHYARAAADARKLHRSRCTTPHALLHFGKVWLKRQLALRPNTTAAANV